MKTVFGVRSVLTPCILAVAATVTVPGSFVNMWSPATVAVASSSVFAAFPGRWTGSGRLGFKDGKVETVDCRATYFLSDDKTELSQNIRCASPSGKIEVKSKVTETAGKLSGTWNELMYEKSGELTGEATPRGLRVAVKGTDLDANMDLIIKDNKQVVEIQFHNTTLIGLTLVLTKSDATGPS
jgi:uncharacterized cupredoxin-like copper-binding protein